MKTILSLLIMLALMLGAWLTNANGQVNQSTNPNVRIGESSVILETNGNHRFASPAEFWHGVWKENTNGWRVQLSIQTNGFNSNPVVRVECGNVLMDTSGGYLQSPNGKFVKFELRDANGNIIAPKPNAGTNLLKDLYSHPGYGTIPVWAIAPNGAMEQNFPLTISTNLYPTFPQCSSCRIAGYISVGRDSPPVLLNLLNIDDFYAITNKGVYALTVQPVVYSQRLDYFPASREQLMEILEKQGYENVAQYMSNGVYFVNTNANDHALHRVDLPEVSAKIHLAPSN
jgi:hypothetical protein